MIKNISKHRVSFETVVKLFTLKRFYSLILNKRKVATMNTETNQNTQNTHNTANHNHHNVNETVAYATEHKADMTTEPTAKKTSPGYLAMVEKMGMQVDPETGMVEDNVFEIIEAVTKREMKTKLADPTIVSVMCVIKGKQIKFTESKKITF